MIFMMRKVIYVLLLVFILGGSVNAEGYTAKTVSMKYYSDNIYQDSDFNCFKATNKDLKQAKKLWNKLKKLKKNSKMVLSTKKYKNLEKLMRIIDAKYLPYITLDYIEESDYKHTKITIKGKDVKKAIKSNNKYSKKYKKLIKNIGINKNTSEETAVVLINNYLRNLLTYGENSSKYVSKYDDHSGLYSKKGICIDYAYLFQYLAKTCGLKCGIVLDHTQNHAYNIVYINNKETYIDVCWNDCLNENLYIFLSENDISKDHNIDVIVWFED